MNRRLIKQAGQAITLTLPIKWIRENNLKAGDEVNLINEGKELIIKSDKNIKGEKIYFDFQNFSKKMNYVYINAAYSYGFDEMQIKNISSIPDLSQNMGLIISENTKNIVTLKDMTGINTENVEDIIKRVFHMLIDFYQKAIDDCFGEKKASNEDWLILDREINKYTLFLERAVMKMQQKNTSSGKVLFAYSFFLEILGDNILRFWRCGLKSNNSSKNIKKLVEYSKESLIKAFEVHTQANSKRIKEILNMKFKSREMYEEIQTDKNNLTMLMYSIKIIEDSSDLAHLSLMNSFKN